MYYDQRDRMVERQAQIITDKNEEVKALKKKIDLLEDRLAAKEQYADFYLKMQETILASPALMIEWQRFCLVMKLVDPDEKKYSF